MDMGEGFELVTLSTTGGGAPFGRWSGAVRRASAEPRSGTARRVGRDGRRSWSLSFDLARAAASVQRVQRAGRRPPGSVCTSSPIR